MREAEEKLQNVKLIQHELKEKIKNNNKNIMDYQADQRKIQENLK